MKRNIIILISVALFIFCGNATSFAQRVSVKVPEANIRSGPGTKYEIIWKIEKYHPLKVTEKKGLWFKFEDYEGDPGWIHKTLVNNTPSIITNKKSCNVRSGPGTKNDIIFGSEKGVPYKILKRKGNWIHVQHSDGDKGWIHRSLVW